MTGAHEQISGPRSDDVHEQLLAGINVAPGSDDDGWIEPPPVRLADGTDVQLYKDGQVLHAARCAIEQALREICLEIYIFHSDDTGRALADCLARRARDGVVVRAIYDSIGSLDTDRRMFDEMRRAGVQLEEFHPAQPWRCRNGWRIFNRDHRKLLVIDREAALLGGQNIGNEYGSSWVIGKTKGFIFRDTAIGLRGPAVRLLSEVYERIWRYVRGGGPIHRAEFVHTSATFGADPDGDGLMNGQPADRIRKPSRLDPRGSVLHIPPDALAVLASVPSSRSRLLPNLQKLLRDARESIDLTMAYFVPPRQLTEQLCASARNGVRVRLMLAGRSDVPLLLVAARAHYDQLMAAGVEIYERQHAVLHAKTLSLDERLSMIGSTNLDYRSIQHNCELSVLVHSLEFGRQMRALFEHDVRYSARVPPDESRHRPTRDRLVQTLVAGARYLL